VYEWGGKCGHSPARVAFPDAAAPACVAAGARHRACACSDGRLYLWGSGHAVRGTPTLPRFVDGARVSCSPDSLVCTWRGTAFLAADGCVNVIGPNDFMQHGAASTSQRAAVTFAAADRCIKLIAGSEHFAAVLARDDGSLRIVTWGWGEHGQLGSGSILDGAPRSVAEFKAGARVHVASGAAFVVAVVVRQPNQ
jgi:secretion-regulating guanine nucleotide exchange factor